MFDRGGAWNWVDENNSFVGYRPATLKFDNQSCCCESFGYSYETVEPVQVLGDYSKANTEIDLTAFRFDPTYFKEIDGSEGDGDAVFKLIRDDGDPIFLRIFNHHNGYYAHGFTFKCEGHDREGSL